VTASERTMSRYCETCDGRLVVGAESWRVPASEYCHCPAPDIEDDDDEESDV